MGFYANQPDAAGAAYGWGDGPAVTAPPSSMVEIPAGVYELGDPDEADAPSRKVRLDPFMMDATEVTNDQFAAFVKDTGHITTAEKEGGSWLYVGGTSDWEFVPGSNWRQPLGDDSDINQAGGHPVVCVSWNDAAAYAKWAGKRLPTEAEWEAAARAGMEESHHHGSEHHDQDPGKGNTWQGTWPQKNTLADGYFYTSPAGAYAASEAGLYDMIGNVWEWTADWYEADPPGTDEIAENPTGAASGDRRVARGGSWFCSPNYCAAYRPGFRGKSPPDRSFNNVGFRCAKDSPASAP